MQAIQYPFTERGDYWVFKILKYLNKSSSVSNPKFSASNYPINKNYGLMIQEGNVKDSRYFFLEPIDLASE